MGFDVIVLVQINHVSGNQLLNTLDYLLVASDKRNENLVPDSEIEK